MFPHFLTTAAFSSPHSFLDSKKENQKRKTKSLLKKLGAQMGHFQIVLAC